MNCRSPEYQRMMYQKHREKRLAAKKATYDAEKQKEKNQRYYAENQAELIRYAREYRKERSEELSLKARERYYANHEEKKARNRELAKRPEARERQYGYIRDWMERNPDKVARYNARRRLVEQTGASPHEISDDLADAKAEELKIMRWVREQIAAQADRNPEGHDPAEGHGRNDESPVAAGDAPKPSQSQESWLNG